MRSVHELWTSADPSAVVGPGSLLSQRIDKTSPVGWGMQAKHPVWFLRDHAYRVTDGDKYKHEVVSRYPDGGKQL